MAQRRTSKNDQRQSRSASHRSGTMNQILALSGVAQAALIRDRRISPEELFQLHLDRIAAVNPAINAVVELLPRSMAAACPLHCVPFTINDSIEVEWTV